MSWHSNGWCHPGGVDLTEWLNALIAGLVVGGGFSLLAVGISLIFSTTGVLNLGHAAFAMVAAYLYVWLSSSHGWPVGAAALVAVAVTTGLGVGVERVVMRRLADAAPTTKLIMTLGVLALTQGLMLQFFGFQPKAARTLLPAHSVSFAGVGVQYQQIAVVFAALVLVGLLGGFLRSTRTGLAVRAVAQDHQVARLLGIRRHRIASLNWATGAFMAAVAGVLMVPLTILTIDTFPLYIVLALAATLFGGVSGLSGAFVGGFVIGIVQSFAATASSTPGIPSLAVFVVILVLLLVRRKWPAELSGSATLGSGIIGSRLAYPARILLAGVSIFALVKSLESDFWGYVGALALIYMLVGLSLVVLTGYTGQVSLMQGGLVGLGAFSLTWYLNRLHLPLWLAIVFAALTGMAVGGVAALPALRLKSLQLGIATLAISSALSDWAFNIHGVSWVFARPSALVSDRHVFYVLLPVTAIATLLVRSLRRGAWGRRFLAVKQSGDTAAHFGISPVRVRVGAFLLSGFLASLAGAFWLVLVTAIKPTDFNILLSISFLLYIVVGGTESLAGPLIAGLVFAYGPQVVKVSQATASALPTIISGALVVLLVAARPDGLAGFLTRRARRSTRPDEGLAVLEVAPVRLAHGNGRRLSRPSPTMPVGAP